MTNMRDIIELSGCDDCVQLIANGEYPVDNTEAQDKALDAAIDARWSGYHLCVAGGENTESEFSWQPCDICGSKLGGSRYPCAAWQCETV